MSLSKKSLIDSIITSVSCEIKANESTLYSKVLFVFSHIIENKTTEGSVHINRSYIGSQDMVLFYSPNICSYLMDTIPGSAFGIDVICESGSVDLFITYKNVDLQLINNLQF